MSTNLLNPETRQRKQTETACGWQFSGLTKPAWDPTKVSARSAPHAQQSAPHQGEGCSSLGVFSLVKDGITGNNIQTGWGQPLLSLTSCALGAVLDSDWGWDHHSQSPDPCQVSPPALLAQALFPSGVKVPVLGQGKPHMKRDRS